MTRLLWFIPAVLLLLAVLLVLGDDSSPVRVETVATTSTTSTVPSTTTSVATTTTHYHPPTTAKAAAVARSAPIVRPVLVAPSERWLALADCESGDGDGRPPYSYDDDYRGVHHGALQWSPATWTRARQLSGLDVPATAYEASFEQEVAVAKDWLRRTSPNQWPVCGPRVGLSQADAA